MGPADPAWWAQRYRTRGDDVGDRVAAGTPVVGVVGADVPVELVEAAGAVPVRLTGDPGPPSAEARHVLGAAVDAPTLTLLTRLLGGSAAGLAGLVVSRDCQSSLAMFYALRELRRLDPWRGLPPVHLLDLLHLPRASTTAYDTAEVLRLADVLTGWTGRAPLGPDAPAGALADALRPARALRERLLLVQQRRRAAEPTVTGSLALHVHGVVSTVPAAEAVELLDALLAADLPALSAGRRVFLTGSVQDHDAHYAALEDAGWHVAGEDHDRGDLALTVQVPAEPTAGALALARQRRGPASPTASVPDRAAWTTAEAARCGAHVVLSLVRAHDEAPGWDVPAQRRALAACGVPLVTLVGQPHRTAPADLLAALAAPAVAA
ncbi:Benzoyl-CoA reductase/2-hydroxyglutaryl-CoA dehydratase subunit, BcrC/BadD/HgdB [Klenkia soli]|uniref:Benzoyl-CoA reductase/2-hydroxyglutaryl-CoA dehydratase subunit, BcrC/BadD/HgdB n=1 Tax=Klenkia soli TaxID=1052260 RepID=A0A1H0JDQ2_9ACTN|nr:2-hydroxyacyl-CoA dehydratase family protein [Klenkia soli]SDO41589.1 Benzoyl-CoA reductase/2-hydroxyglutaryl-CoA dehydratase subunit, BcrC/BadD/HgdB [Klenkia soli]